MFSYFNPELVGWMGIESCYFSFLLSISHPAGLQFPLFLLTVPPPSPCFLTCRNRKSFSTCLSLSSLSSCCSWGSGGSCLMTSPRRGPVSCTDVVEDDEDEEERPWCSLSSSSVSSGWLWCCLAGPEVLEPAAETWSLGLDMILGMKKRRSDETWKK